jgi:MFS family permease
MGSQGHKRALNFIAASTLLSAGCLAMVFLSSALTWCLVLFVFPSVIMNFYLAPVLGQTQSLVSLRMRAVASSLLILILNVVGLLLGPALTGLLSDLLRASQGAESLRYALLISTVSCCR